MKVLGVQTLAEIISVTIKHCKEGLGKALY